MGARQTPGEKSGGEAELLRRIRSAERARALADMRLRRAIIEASAAGISYSVIARASKLSKNGVHVIVTSHREGDR